MNTDLIQHTRYKLQRRTRRVNSNTGNDQCERYVGYFLDFIESTPIIRGLLEDLTRRHPEMPEMVDGLIAENGRDKIEAASESEQAALSYEAVKRSQNEDAPDIWHLVRDLSTTASRKRWEAQEHFFDHYVEFLYDYIDEHLDDQRALLALLRRYKHRCEWFERERLYKLWESDTQNGELRLAEDLYAYLHDQGIDFTMETESASGRIDLVKAQTGMEPLVADVKLFHTDKSKDKSYIAKGIGQIYQYTQDFNQPFGYLIVFNICEDRIDLALSGVNQNTPFVVHNNKTLFVLEIDIFQYKDPASKRGKIKSHEITEDYLIEHLD